MAERGGLEPPQRHRWPRISNPAPYRLGQRSIWRQQEDPNPHILSESLGFLDRALTISVCWHLVGRVGVEPTEGFPRRFTVSAAS